MKKFILFIKFSASIVLFLGLHFLVPLIINPVFGIDLTNVEMGPMDNFISGMVVMSFVQISILILVSIRSQLRKWRLALFLAAILFSINNVLNTIESLVFTRNIYPVDQQMTTLFGGLIISILMGGVLSLFWGRKEEGPVLRFNWSPRIILPWCGWIIIWFVIYFTAGFLIPMSVPGVSDYYFSGAGAMDMSLVPLGYLMQIPRGSIWILLAIGLSLFQKGTVWEKRLITGLVFGCIMSSNLLMPNPIMPDLVRLAHLPEILFANLLWGVIISLKVESFVLKD